MARLRDLLLCVLVSLVARPVLADATVFLGANTTPENRAVKGAAVGVGLLLLAFEVEYSATGSDAEDAAPSLKTGMGNILLQTPFDIGGVQAYVTTGTGFYRERLNAQDHRDTGLGTNVGGGLKISLAGPVRLRVDYRLFRLGEDALHQTVHRVYAGVNLRF